ncbi:MAG: hypothetical protein ABWX88_06810 [Pseudoxanthomonas sp.]
MVSKTGKKGSTKSINAPAKKPPPGTVRKIAGPRVQETPSRPKSGGPTTTK